MTRRAALPNFKNPPVVEVALSVQFEPVEEFKTPHIGLLWDAEFRQGFPLLEEHKHLGGAPETFEHTGQRTVTIEFGERPKPPRVWFLDESRVELIQLQFDRFAHNWRKTQGGEYPRYHRIRDKFEPELKSLDEFLKCHKLGSVHPTHCEITYVNMIHPSGVWTHHGEFEKVFTVWSGQTSSPFELEVEDGTLMFRYKMKDKKERPFGRLYAVIKTMVGTNDRSLAYHLQLTARGYPIGAGLGGVLRFLDAGRKHIVRCFASITTPAMHERWERQADK